MNTSRSLSQKAPFWQRLILVIDADPTVGTTLMEVVKTETPYRALLATSIIDVQHVLQSCRCDLFLLADPLSPMSKEFSAYVSTLPGYEGTPIYFAPGSIPDQAKQYPLPNRPFELDRLLQAVQNLLG